MRYDKRCENCGRFHNGEYGSGRFCSKKCASAYSSKFVSKEGRKKQKETLTNKTNKEKALTIRKENSDNYTKDSEGRWQKVSNNLSNKKSTKDNALTTASKIGKLKTAQKFADHGYNVFAPLVDNTGVDMIVEKDDGLKKVQVKTAINYSDEEAQSVQYDLDRTKSKSKKKKYNKNHIDYYALYNDMNKNVCLIENNNDRTCITIRDSGSPISSTTTGKNLERLHMEDKYLIDKVLDDIDNNIHQSDIIECNDFVDKSNE